MERKQGIHFYINIKNFNRLVTEEEASGGVNHSIHALDTFFSSIERYGSLRTLNKEKGISEDELNTIKSYANKVNLTDMAFPSARQQLSFENLSKSIGKKIIGVPLFADAFHGRFISVNDFAVIDKLMHAVIYK